MSQEADKFWRDLDDQLLEEEQALDEFRDYLDQMTIEEAETAVSGLHEYMHELEHPPFKQFLMGWERIIYDMDSDSSPDSDS